MQAQFLGLPAGQHGGQHPFFIVGVRALGMLHRGGAVQVIDNEVPHRLRVGGHDRADLAHVDALDGAVCNGAFQDHAQNAVQAGGRAVEISTHQHNAEIADHQRAANRHTGVLIQNHRHNVGAAGGRADVKNDSRTHSRQNDCEAKLQKDIIGQRAGQRADALTQADIERQRKGGVDRPPHRPHTQKDKAQCDQRRVDEPHERAHIPPREQRCQHDRQAGGAAERKMVGRFENGNAHCRGHKAEIQQKEKFDIGPQLPQGQVLFQLR